MEIFRNIKNSSDLEGIVNMKKLNSLKKKKKKDEQSQSTKAGWWKHQEHNQSEILWDL